MTLAEINRRIQRVEPLVELVRGEGYHYYVFSVDRPLVYETESVWTPYTSHVSARRWIADGIEYGQRMREQFAI